MEKKTKYSLMVYSAWNYEKEIDDLNKASEQGWQLVKGGCFHSKFEKNPDVRYRYQLDYQKIDNKGRYIETFREQGWEYINSTFNGWHYFRKLYDPSLPEEEYEIFTDRESLQQMKGRWAHIALGISIALALFAIIYAVRTFRTPQLPLLIVTLTFAIESAVLMRGVFIMRNPEASHSRRGDSAFLIAFIALIVTGAVSYLVLSEMRPDFWTEQRASEVDDPVIDNRWADFTVRYPDNYYLDLEFRSDEPMRFAIISSSGDVMYSQTGTSFSGKNIRVKLPRGQYCFSMSCTSGYELKCDLE